MLLSALGGTNNQKYSGPLYKPHFRKSIGLFLKCNAWANVKPHADV